MAKIELGIHGIAIEGDFVLGQPCGINEVKLTSLLHAKGDGKVLNAAWNAIESMVLAHAVAGVDITTPAYKEGLETAIEAVMNEYED